MSKANQKGMFGERGKKKYCIRGDGRFCREQEKTTMGRDLYKGGKGCSRERGGGEIYN